MKLHRWINLIREKCSTQELLLCTLYFWSYCPLLIFILHFWSHHNSYTRRAINLNLHRWIYLIEQKCSAQELLLCTSCFWSYCPLLFFYTSHVGNMAVVRLQFLQEQHLFGEHPSVLPIILLYPVLEHANHIYV